MPQLLRSLSLVLRSDGALALLNLLPCLIACLWHLAIRPGFSVVIGDYPHHPALVGFSEPERSAIGVYRRSAPEAALLIPGYSLPGVVSLVGAPAPDGTRVALSFPGSTLDIELPQNDGESSLRRCTILWPEYADAPGAVAVPIEVQLPWGAAQVQIPASLFFGAVAIPIEARTSSAPAGLHPSGLLVTRVEAAPVYGNRQAPLALVLGLAVTQCGYGLAAYRLFVWSGRRAMQLSLGIGLMLAIAALWVQTWMVADGVVFLMFVLALGSVATVAVTRMAFQRKRRSALLLGGGGLILGGMLGVWFGAMPFLGFAGSVCVGIFAYVIRLVRRKVYALALAALFCAVIYANGISFGPSEEYRLLSENPFVVTEKINYFQESVFMPLIAHYTHSTDRFSYYALSLVIAVISYGLFCLLSIRHYGETIAVIVTAMLMTGQLTTVILSWIGKPDSMTLLLTIPLLFVRSPAIMIALSTLGLTNHIAYVISGIMTLAARMAVRERIGLFHFLSVILGSFLGYLLVRMFLWYYGIEVYTRMDFILERGIEFFVETNSRHLLMNILLLFGFQWIAVIISFFVLFFMDRLFFWVSVSMIVLAFTITFFVVDFTRVFQVMMWGFFVRFIVHSYSLLNLNIDRVYTFFLVVIVVFSLVLPRLQSFHGSIFAAPFTLVFP